MRGEGDGAASGRRRPRGGRPFAFPVLAAAAILLSCLIAYGGALRYGFVGDDLHLIADRLPAYARGFPVAEAFTHSFWKGGAYGALPGEAKDYYRPLVTLSYALDARIGGGRPVGFHLTNLLLHAIASGLVLLLLRRLKIRRLIALPAALVFALHPIHVASVAWISGRTDLLCAVFLLVAFDRVAAAIDRRLAGPAAGGPPGPALAIGLAAYLLALLSKEMALPLFLLVLLFLLLRRAGAARAGRAFPRRAWMEPAAVLAVTIAYVLFRAAVLGLPDLRAGARSADVPVRWAVLPAILTYYGRVLFFPGSLALEVPFRAIASALDPRVLAGLAILAILIAGAILLTRRAHPAGFGLGWILLSLLPVSSLVPLVFRALVTEYWAYIPSVGFVVLLAAGLPDLARRIARVPAGDAHARIAAGVLGALALAGLAWIPFRASPLRSDESLQLAQLRRDPDRVESWVSLATEYGSRGEIDRAFSCLREAVARRPRERGVQLTLGNLFDLRGEPDSAEAAYRREILFQPASDEARVSLADMCLRRGADEEALRLYRDVLARGAFPAPDLIARARALSAAALAPPAALPWPKRAEELRLAAGILGCLDAAGVAVPPDMALARASMELDLGRFDRARAAVASARRAGSPSSAIEPLDILASLAAGDPGAIDRAVPFFRADRASADAARSLADLRASAGRTDDALPIWRALLRAGLLSPEELNHVAVTALNGASGAPPSADGAERIWTMLMAEKPDHPLALLNLGGLAYTAGDRDRCRALWRRFLRLYPDRPEAASVREKLAAP